MNLTRKLYFIVQLSYQKLPKDKTYKLSLIAAAKLLFDRDFPLILKLSAMGTKNQHMMPNAILEKLRVDVTEATLSPEIIFENIRKQQDVDYTQDTIPPEILFESMKKSPKIVKEKIGNGDDNDDFSKFLCDPAMDKPDWLKDSDRVIMFYCDQVYKLRFGSAPNKSAPK